MLIYFLSYLIQTITGGIMKNASTNNSILVKYYWWAQTAPMEVLTRKTRKTRNQLPQIKDAFHM